MAIASEKEVQQFKNRLRDLAEKSYHQNQFTFTSFLGLAEQDIFWQMEGELGYATCALWGGDEETDRKVLRFGSAEELGYEEPFAIACIHIKPLNEKFSDDLTHRDFLGALMNLGIERSTLGDIRVGGKEAYLFCLENIAGFICDHLDQVRHTHVRCETVAEISALPKEEPEQIQVQVTSERIDAVLAKVYNQSRSEVLELFRSGKIYVNGRLCENNSRLLKEGETVNARGFGKFHYLGVGYETRKGKLSVAIAVYR